MIRYYQLTSQYPPARTQHRIHTTRGINLTVPMFSSRLLSFDFINIVSGRIGSHRLSVVVHCEIGWQWNVGGDVEDGSEVSYEIGEDTGGYACRVRLRLRQPRNSIDILYCDSPSVGENTIPIFLKFILFSSELPTMRMR